MSPQRPRSRSTCGCGVPAAPRRGAARGKPPPRRACDTGRHERTNSKRSGRNSECERAGKRRLCCLSRPCLSAIARRDGARAAIGRTRVQGGCHETPRGTGDDTAASHGESSAACMQDGQGTLADVRSSMPCCVDNANSRVSRWTWHISTRQLLLCETLQRSAPAFGMQWRGCE
jgi:hypothetical protein